MPVQTVFMSDYRSAGGRYSSGAFLLSFSLFALIPEALSAMLFAVIMDIATGMRHSPRVFFEFFLGCWAQVMPTAVPQACHAEPPVS
jgi:hypothetical protein